MGNIPNLYVYAANNPSESILAKRRWYGTMISHNVPPIRWPHQANVHVDVIPRIQDFHTFWSVDD